MARRPWREKLFEWLLRLFPAEFRGDFGQDMAADFRDQQHEAAANGRRPVLRLWMRTGADLIWRAPIEHLDILRRDAGYALRLLRRRPAFTATVVLTLAIGIGLNTAVFSVVSGVLLRELPVPQSDRIVRLYEINASDPGNYGTVSSANFIDWQSRTNTLDAIALTSLDRGVLLTGEGDPELVTGSVVTERFFDIIGARLVVGRTFTRDEYQNAPMMSTRDVAPGVMVLSHDLWQRQFRGHPDIIGMRVRLGDRSLRVVGVLADDVSVLGLSRVERPDYWVPGRPNSDQRRARMAVAVGRLAPGASKSGAQAEFSAIGLALAAAYPEANGNWSIRLGTPLEHVVSGVEAQLWFLSAAAMCLLLISAANVINLLLGHASGRRQEMATRVAIGATRGHLVRQLLTESIVLSVAGGLGGVVLAYGAVPVLIALAPDHVPRLESVSVDTRVLAFATIVSLAVGVGCGLAASLAPSALRPEISIRSGRVESAGRSRRFRQGLTVTQVALAMLLVVAAGLLVRTMRHLDAVELGFDPRNVIAAELNPDFLKDGSVPRVADFQAALIRQARELPGVVALGTGPRPFGGGLGNVVRVAPEDAGVRTSVDPVSPGYMAALRMRVIRGRLFDRSDLGGVAKVAVVNESAVRQLWPGVDPVGRSLFIDTPPQELTVVGVVADVRKGGLEQDFRPIVYILQTQTRSMLYTTLLIRADGDPNTVVPAVRTILKRLDPEQPLTRVETLEEILARQTAPRRFMLHLVGLFSILALSLAMVGIYGVLAESVAQRVPEIGVRMALGATRRTITGMILSQGAWMVGLGVVIGLAAAFASRGVMTSFMFGVPTSDIATYVAATLAVALLALMTSTIPARRAASVDPVVARRQE